MKKQSKNITPFVVNYNSSDSDGTSKGLDTRELKILRAVIHEYIRTVAPVSSKTLSTKPVTGLSPATIRSVMARLEKKGYLCRQHTSGGRIPTDTSFRLYVDTLRELEELQEGEKNQLDSAFERSVNTKSAIKGAARSLAGLTHCAGFILTPGPAGLPIKHIRLVHVNTVSVLVVIVFTGGHVSTKLACMDDGEGFLRLNLEAMSNYLNTISTGLTIDKLRERVLEEMQSEKILYDRLLSRALKLAEIAATRSDAICDEEIYMDGTSYVFDQPEFTEDLTRMKRLFAAFEQKGLLLKILDSSLLKTGSRRVYIGSECDVQDNTDDLRGLGLSFVTSTYGTDNNATCGTVGIIGPVRMNYPKVIPLVNYAASLLGQAL